MKNYLINQSYRPEAKQLTTKNKSNILACHHRPFTPTGQCGAFVAASKYCRIASSAFIMEIENPERNKNGDKIYHSLVINRMLFQKSWKNPNIEMNNYIISKPAISREVMKDPVYTLSTANPCSSCNWGTAFPAAIISSIAGVAPSLKFWKQ